MKGVPTEAIGDLCTLINGRAFKPSDWTDDGIPIVRIQNLNDHAKPFNKYNGEVRERFLIDDGEILLSWSGTPGTSFGCFIWNRGRGILNQHIFKVHVRDGIDPNYFVHAVNSKLDEMISLAHGGVGLRHITKGKLEGILLPVPSPTEQQRIVEFINGCLVRIEEVAELRRESLKIARSLFAAHIKDAVGAGEWKQVALEDLLEESRNGRSVRQDSENASGAVLTLSAVRDVVLDAAASKPIVLDDATAGSYAVRLGDVFVSRSNTRELVGLSAQVVTEPPDRLIYPDLLIRLRPKAKLLDARYLTYALRLPSVRHQIQERATGSSQSMVKISGKRLREVAIPLPDLESQRALVEQFQEASTAAAGILQALDQPECHALKSAVLRRVFDGEIG